MHFTAQLFAKHPKPTVSNTHSLRVTGGCHHQHPSLSAGPCFAWVGPGAGRCGGGAAAAAACRCGARAHDHHHRRCAGLACCHPAQTETGIHRWVVARQDNNTEKKSRHRTQQRQLLLREPPAHPILSTCAHLARLLVGVRPALVQVMGELAFSAPCAATPLAVVCDAAW